MLFNPAMSLEINPGASGIAKPKLKTGMFGVGAADLFGLD
jgi:hypothetical protein